MDKFSYVSLLGEPIEEHISKTKFSEKKIKLKNNNFFNKSSTNFFAKNDFIRLKEKIKEDSPYEKKLHKKNNSVEVILNKEKYSDRNKNTFNNSNKYKEINLNNILLLDKKPQPPKNQLVNAVRKYFNERKSKGIINFLGNNNLVKIKTIHNQNS